MGFLRKLFSGGDAPDQGAYFYVRCDACGEAIRIRVHLANDPEPVFEGPGDDPSGYELHKEILGNRCFKLIYGTWRFDASKRLLDSEIEGGTELTAAEYEAATAQS